MADWLGRLDALLGELDHGVKQVARAAKRIVGEAPTEVLAYRGYGNAERARVAGRVLEKRRITESSDHDSALRNLLNTYYRVDADAVGFADVVVKYLNRAATLKADNEGFFGATIHGAGTNAPDDEWHAYDVELVSPLKASEKAATASGELLVPPASATCGVISDLDDTVIQSRVTNFLQAARTVMLGNARTRLPFPGVAAFYEALRNGAGGEERNPMFYVSSSPWNIYDVITEFMDLQRIPRGPVMLRDWDITWGAMSAGRHLAHKGEVIRDIMATYPDMPFILLGDTSQQDPEIYRQIVDEHPSRVRAIYIRDVNRNADRTAKIQRLAEEVLAAGSTLVLAEDTYAAARHAAEQGWIKTDALPAIHEEKHADEGKTGDKVATPDGGKPTSGAPPKVVG